METQNNTEVLLKAILDRMDSFEKTVKTVEASVQQLPGIFGMVVDSVDESVDDAQKQGVNVDERLTKGLHLLEKLTEPKVLDVMSKLVEKLDKVSLLVEQLEKFPQLVAMFTDTADEVYSECQQKNIDIDERVHLGKDLLVKMTTPKNIQTLSKVVDKIDHLEMAVENLEKLPQMMAMAGDCADEFYQENLHGVDLAENLENGLKTFVHLTSPEATKIMAILFAKERGVIAELHRFLDSPEFSALMQSKVFDPKAIEVISVMGESLVSCRENHSKVGIFGLLRAAFDNNIRQAMGFLVCFAKNFGTTLQKQNQR